MKKIAALTVAVLISACVLLYAIDYLLWRYKLSAGHDPYGTVTVQFYYAVQEKTGKMEYGYQPPQPDTCVNALFPHADTRPAGMRRNIPRTNQAISQAREIQRQAKGFWASSKERLGGLPSARA